MTVTYKFRLASEYPTMYGIWRNGLNAVKDLSTGTLVLKIVSRADPSDLVYTKSSGVTGYAAAQGTAPHTYNWLAQWATGEIAANVPAGVYTGLLQHTAVSGGMGEQPEDICIIVEADPA